MAEAKSGKRGGCFKFGCLGCVGIAIVLLLIGGFVLVVGLIANSRDVRLEETSAAEYTPPSPDSGLPPVSTDVGDESSFPLGDYPLSAEQTGTIVLDFSMGQFDLLPAEPGTPIRVEGEYDSNSYELEAEFQSDPGGGWRYELHFDSKASLFQLFGDNASKNRIKLYVPRGVPFALKGRVGIGQSRLELGGLWVTDVNLGLGTGEHNIEFDEPLPAPLERFLIDGAIGQTTITRLGNASPARVEVDHNIGEMMLDLRGTWSRDADVSLRCGIGQCSIRVPDAASVRLTDTGMMIGEFNSRILRQLPEPGTPGIPTLSVELSNRIGEAAFVR